MLNPTHPACAAQVHWEDLDFATRIVHHLVIVQSAAQAMDSRHTIIFEQAQEVASKVAQQPGQQNIDIGAFASGTEWCCELKIFGEPRFFIPVDDVDRASPQKSLPWHRECLKIGRAHV